jgi:flagellar assembly protein FliH
MSNAMIKRVRMVDAQPAAATFRATSGLSLPEPQEVDEAIEGEALHESAPQPDLFALAYESGRKAAEAEFAIERTALLRMIATAEAFQSESSEELAALIAETVEALVTKIVGDVAIDRSWLTERAEAAAALVRDCDNARTIYAHPEDIALLKGAVLPLSLLPDPDAARGSIRINCSAGWIESGTALYLDALRVELGLKEMKS